MNTGSTCVSDSLGCCLQQCIRLGMNLRCMSENTSGEIFGLIWALYASRVKPGQHCHGRLGLRPASC